MPHLAYTGALATKLILASRLRRPLAIAAGLLAVALALPVHHGYADTLAWNPGGSTTGGTDGSGAWSTGSAGPTNWYDSTTTTTEPVSWIAGSNAVIGSGGAPGVITLGSSISAASLSFNAINSSGTPNQYTIAGNGSDALTLSGSSVVMNANATISAPVNFSGGLILSGTGTLTVGGTNTFGTSSVQIGTGSTAAIPTLSATTAGSLISGTGSIILDGGILVYSGGGSISNVIQMSDNGTTPNTSTIGAGGTTFTINGAISNTSALGDTVVLQGGTMNLTSTLTPTTFTHGTLQIASGAYVLFGYNGQNNLPAATASISLAGQLIQAGSNDGPNSFNSGGDVISSNILLQGYNATVDTGANPLTVSGILSGSQLLVNSNGSTGSLTLANASNTFSGGTVIYGGTLNISASGDLGTGGLTFQGGTLLTSAAVNDNRSIYLNAGGGTFNTNGFNDTFSGTFQGSGMLTKAGAGVLTLVGNNTYSGGTTISGGVISVASDANLGSPAGAVTLDGGTLNYTGATGTIANPLTVSGPAPSLLTNSGSGTLTLMGPIANHLGGTLALSGGTFNLNEVGSGGGTFEVGDGPSTVIVSTPDAFGTGAVIVNAGSTLETLDASVNSGTPIAIQAGTYTQQPGSTLILRATSPATCDSIALGSGPASLDGELSLMFSGFSPLTGERYLVVGTSGRIGGTFSSVVLTGAPSTSRGLAVFVAGTGEEIYIESQYFLLSGLTPNQAAVAAYFNNNATAPGTAVALVNALNGLSILPQGQQGAYLNLLTPQDYARLPDQAFQNSTFMQQAVFGQVQNAFEGGGFNTSGLTVLKTTNTDPFSVAMHTAMDSAEQQARNSVADMDAVLSGTSPQIRQREGIGRRLSGFVLGTITLDQRPQNAGLPGEHFTTGGVLSGIDYRLTRNLMVGALFNWNYTGGTVDNVGSRQQANSYTPGLFAGYSQRGFYADGLISNTYNSYKLNRNLVLPGSTSVATGEPQANQYDAAALGGYYLKVARGLQLGPAIGAAYTQMTIGSFKETGSLFDLSVSKQHAESLRSLVGLQGRYHFRLGTNPLPVSITFNAFWQHEFLNSSRTMSASFTELGNGSFLYNTPGPSSRNSALLGIGVGGYLWKNVSLFVNYESQIGTNNQLAQTVMAGVGVSF